MTRKLFLLRGSDAFDVTADEFVPAAGGCDARIALLLQGGASSQKHVSEYVRPWTKRGVSYYDDEACVVFEDEQFARVVGQAAYEIVMSDFQTRASRIRQVGMA